jgi:hypothetical protein
MENKEENNEENKIEMSSSSDYAYNNKNKRKKGEIIEFMKSNRQKMKDMEIKKKEDKENAEIKKFMEIIKLQKDIEDSKKINQMNNSSKNRRITLNNKINREANDFYVGNNLSEDNNNPKLSIESSISSLLNQREFYLNCYETQQIYATQDNLINLFKTEPNISRKDKNKMNASEINYLYGNYCGNNFNVSGIKKKKKKKQVDKNININNINLLKERNNSKKINYIEMKKVIDRLSCFMDQYKKSTNKIDSDINNIIQEKNNELNNEKINSNNYQQNIIQSLPNSLLDLLIRHLRVQVVDRNSPLLTF